MTLRKRSGQNESQGGGDRHVTGRVTERPTDDLANRHVMQEFGGSLSANDQLYGNGPVVGHIARDEKFERESSSPEQYRAEGSGENRYVRPELHNGGQDRFRGSGQPVDELKDIALEPGDPVTSHLNAEYREEPSRREGVEQQRWCRLVQSAEEVDLTHAPIQVRAVLPR
jgi:hypothetical protein